MKNKDEMNKNAAGVEKLGEEELKNVSGGCGNWLTGEPDFLDVSFNPLLNKYFCPECNDGEHLLSKYGDVTVSSGDEVNVFYCDNCHTWFWRYITGKWSGKWVVRPDQD